MTDIIPTATLGKHTEFYYVRYSANCNNC